MGHWESKTVDRQIPPMNYNNRIVPSVLQTDAISSRSSLPNSNDNGVSMIHVLVVDTSSELFMVSVVPVSKALFWPIMGSSHRQYVVGRRWGHEHTTGNVRHSICSLGRDIQGGMQKKRGKPERGGGRGGLNVATVR